MSNAAVENAVKLANAQAWRPENSGDSITGTVVGFRTHTSSEYGEAPVVVVEDSDGVLTGIFVFQKMLEDALSEIRPQVGDVLTVAYAGHKLKNGIDPSKADAKDYYHHFLAWVGDEPPASSLRTVSPFGSRE